MTVRLSALLDQPTLAVQCKSVARFVQGASGNTVHLVVVMNEAGVPFGIRLRPEGVHGALMTVTQACLADLTYVDHKDVNLEAIVALARHYLLSKKIIELGDPPAIVPGPGLQPYYIAVTGDEDVEKFKLLYAAAMHATSALALLATVCGAEPIVELHDKVLAVTEEEVILDYDKHIAEYGALQPEIFEPNRMATRERMVAVLVFAALINKVNF